MKDYYYILGIDNNASPEEIKKAYRKLSLKFHPDKNEGDAFFTERFKEIQEAYETLSNHEKRANFDFKTFQSRNSKSNTSNSSDFENELKKKYEEELKRKEEEIKRKYQTPEQKAAEEADLKRRNEAEKRRKEEETRKVIREKKIIELNKLKEYLINKKNAIEGYKQLITEVELEIGQIKSKISSLTIELNSFSNTPKKENWTKFKTDKGEIEVLLIEPYYVPKVGMEVKKNGLPAPTEKYKLGIMNCIIVNNGFITKETLF
jgi:curved DNA-binding protein CbpA